VIEFENGALYREESADMAATIKSDNLMEKRGEQRDDGPAEPPA